jgi:hypothetical protein
MGQGDKLSLSRGQKRRKLAIFAFFRGVEFWNLRIPHEKRKIVDHGGRRTVVSSRASDQANFEKMEQNQVIEPGHSPGYSRGVKGCLLVVVGSGFRAHNCQGSEFVIGLSIEPKFVDAVFDILKIRHTKT